MSSHPEEADDLPETRSEETKKAKALERQLDLKLEDKKFDEMPLLMLISISLHLPKEWSNPPQNQRVMKLPTLR